MSHEFLKANPEQAQHVVDTAGPDPTLTRTVPGTSETECAKTLPDGVTLLDSLSSKLTDCTNQISRATMTQAQASQVTKSGHPIQAVVHNSERLDNDKDDSMVCAHQKENIFSNSPHKRPNHVLINEYLTGQGIMPHEDGDAYWPIVCTVSLGSSIVYDAYPKAKAEGEQGKKWRILQEPRSLLITTGEMYEECLHGIESVDVDENVREGEGGVLNWDMLRKETREQVEKERGKIVRGTRISLTFRDVIKVKKLGKGLGLLAR